MALDARRRSSLYEKFVLMLGEDDANALMSEFPASEADELVTRQFLRAELLAAMGEQRAEFDRRFELLELRVAGVENQVADLRVEMADRFRQQTVVFGGALAAMTAVLGTLTTIT